MRKAVTSINANEPHFMAFDDSMDGDKLRKNWEVVSALSRELQVMTFDDSMVMGSERNGKLCQVRKLQVMTDKL